MKIIDELDGFIPTIGIECHVQLKTKTKLFAAVDNDAREAAPNTTVSELCFGLPGTLPILNKEAVKLAIRAGKALAAEVGLKSRFDRKHYFYPDLPLGYQITQFEEPILGQGLVQIAHHGQESIPVRITRAHLEADAGKLTHPSGANYSLVDLNRAGTPLLEIVSEPDIHSADVAKAYTKELNLLMRYADVSYANLYYGNMRFDVNISVAEKDSSDLGTRAEIKNLNSFKAVERCIKYEFRRQVDLIKSGQKVIQETRGWNDEEQKTFSQRSKEDAHDYRYMPDPDIPPLSLSQQEVDAAQSEIPFLPNQVREVLEVLNLTPSQLDTLVDNLQYARLMMDLAHNKISPKTQKRIANWLTVEVQSILQGGDNSPIQQDLEGDPSTELLDEDSAIKLKAEELIKLSEMVESGELSSTSAKEVLVELIKSSSSGAEEIARRLDLIQVNDEAAIDEAVKKVLAANPQAVEDIKNG